AWGRSARTLRPSAEIRTGPLVGFSCRPAYFRCDFDQATLLLKMLCCPLGRTSLRSCSVSLNRPESESARSRIVRIRAKLPSTLDVSSFRSIRSTSSAGTGDSNTQLPVPLTRDWNRHSTPNSADETFFCTTDPTSSEPWPQHNLPSSSNTPRYHPLACLELH